MSQINRIPFCLVIELGAGDSIPTIRLLSEMQASAANHKFLPKIYFNNFH